MKKYLSERTIFGLASSAAEPVDMQSFRDNIANGDIRAALQQVFEANGQSFYAIKLNMSYTLEKIILSTTMPIPAELKESFEIYIRKAYQAINFNKVEAEQGFQTSPNEPKKISSIAETKNANSTAGGSGAGGGAARGGADVRKKRRTVNSNLYFSSFSQDDDDENFDDAKMHGSLRRIKCSKDDIYAFGYLTPGLASAFSISNEFSDGYDHANATRNEVGADYYADKERAAPTASEDPMEARDKDDHSKDGREGSSDGREGSLQSAYGWDAEAAQLPKSNVGQGRR